MTERYQLEQDLREAEAMVGGLERYLEGDQLYGSAGSGGFFGSGNLPALTIGALLLRLRRLEHLRDQLTAAQQGRLDAAAAAHQDIRRAHTVRYTERLKHEAVSRLDAMRTFFQEAAENPSGAAAIYRPELLRRTIVEEILPALAQLNASTDDLTPRLRRTDAQLRGVASQPGGFQWDAALEPVYPRETFWWLYQTPRD
jgi:hypothetical protein